jgi:Organic Anion Transporter Polypeptide (OATP) family
LKDAPVREKLLQKYQEWSSWWFFFPKHDSSNGFGDAILGCVSNDVFSTLTPCSLFWFAGAAEIRANKVTEAHKDDQDPESSQANQLSYAKSCSEFGALAKAVLTNPTYLALTLFASCDNFIIAGFTAFGPKYFEFGFSMSPTLAGIMFG